MPQMALTGGAPTPRIIDFAFQSFFDSTKLAGGIAAQQPPIVLPKTEQLGGVAVMLHPSSQTPVAVDFIVGGGGHASGPIVMKPGQVIRPGRFNAFTWGLPFGWLGGGVAQILIAQSERTEFGAAAQSEVIFHRTRIKIIRADTALAAIAPNWPLRFPWPAAISQASGGAAQGSAPVIGVVAPTKIMAKLFNVPTLAQGARVRLIFVNTDDFDRNSAYVVPTAAIGNFAYYDIDWQTFSQSGITVAGGSGTLENQFQELDIPTPLVRLGGDACCVIAVDITQGPAVGSRPLENQFIDIVRYGLL